jgi:hypothetical protein
MADPQALIVVRKALELRRSHPHVPALDVLDLAMQGRQNQPLDFADSTAPGGDHTDPMAPFGQVLGLAFAPDLNADDCAAQAIDFDEAWHLVVLEGFWERYGIG